MHRLPLKTCRMRRWGCRPTRAVSAILELSVNGITINPGITTIAVALAIHVQDETVLTGTTRMLFSQSFIVSFSPARESRQLEKLRYRVGLIRSGKATAKFRPHKNPPPFNFETIKLTA
jgi:hypothetical protein